MSMCNFCNKNHVGVASSVCYDPSLYFSISVMHQWPDICHGSYRQLSIKNAALDSKLERLACGKIKSCALKLLSFFSYVSYKSSKLR